MELFLLNGLEFMGYHSYITAPQGTMVGLFNNYGGHLSKITALLQTGRGYCLYSVGLFFN